MKKILLLICLLGFTQLTMIQGIMAQYADTADSIDRRIPLLYDAKPPELLTGAVSFISGDEIANVPGVNRVNTFSGRLTGFTNYDIDGLPGYENSTLRVRGVHTFSGRRDPLVLIDGRVDDIQSIDPYDIESVVILKDAAATALYGLRSTNGIIMINTKKGKEGRIKVDVNVETSFSQPTRLPKFLDAYQYATLYNEAQLNDNPNATPRYDDTALEGYRTGSDPYKYPNVNWVDEFLKKNYMLTRTNINVSGGTNTAKYYVGANYTNNSGAFQTDNSINKYNTNTTIEIIGVHGNVQLNLWKNLKINTDIRAKKDQRNAPGGYNTSYGTNLLSTLYATPFNANPILNEDGSIAGTSDYRSNPYGTLNYSGYSIWSRTSISSFVDLSFDLSDLVKGLSVEGRAGFNSFTDYVTNRTKSFAVYQMNADGATYTQIGQSTNLGNTGYYSQIVRNFDHYIGLRYKGDFGKNQLDAFVLYERQQVVNAQASPPLIPLTENYQGPKGSLSYRFNNTYLLDFVASMQGNEQYPPNKRYGFFPAVSVGWVVSNESFMKNSHFFDLLKIRGSIGRTGNQINNPNPIYFAYISRYASGGSTYFFGTTPAGAGGYWESQVADLAITWEKCLKKNIGLDFTLLKNRLNGSFDLFSEKNNNILVQNAITAMYGATGVYTPEGIFEDKGYEIQLGWNDKIKDFSYFVNFNFSYAKNKIVYQDEAYQNYPWMYKTGHPVDTRFGYVVDRFYTESDDMASLPDQSQLGAQHPGDLKFKDLNGDGVIDNNDMQAIGNPKLPTTTYGINLGAQYKGFDFSALFHGEAGSTIALSGYTYWDFYNQTGNVMQQHLDRWQPGDGQSAGYPRLTLTNPNNYVSNSYWIRDNSFIRLQYLELGYTLPKKISQKAGMSKARLYVNGNNLYCWDKLGAFDPELSDSGTAFPIQRTFSVGLNIGF